MKKIIYILMFAILISTVYASNADYRVGQQINDTLVLGNNQLGKLVLSKQSYVSENININSFKSYEAERYDKLVWSGNSSIDIKYDNEIRATLVKGDSYLFEKVGEYQFISVRNSSTIGSVLVLTEPSLNIKIKQELYFEDGEEDILLEEKELGEWTIIDEQIISINLDVKKTYQPGIYRLKFIFTNAYRNSTLNKELTLDAIKSYDIKLDDLEDNTIIKAGEFKDMGTLYIKNTGNTIFNIQTAVVGNASDFIMFNNNFTLLKDIDTPIPFLLSIPLQQPDGLYEGVILLTGGETVYDKKFNVTVRDNSPPELLNISYRHKYLHQNNKITIKTRDNVGVKAANVTITTPPNNSSDRTKVYKMSKDLNFFYLNKSFDLPGHYVFNYCIFDESNNKVCKEDNQTFNKKSIFKDVENKKLYSIKYGKTAKIYLFNQTEKIDNVIEVKLKSFQTDIVNDTFDYIVQIVDDEGNVRQFRDINTTVLINSRTGYDLEIQSDKIIQYKGILEFTVPNYIEDINNVVFEGKFLDYDLPEPFSMEGFGVNSTCDVIDNGDLESSYIKCSTYHRVNSKLDTLPIPTTEIEQKLMKDKYDKQIEETNDKIGDRNLVITILFVCVLLLFVIAIYNTQIYPIFRYRVGRR